MLLFGTALCKVTYSATMQADEQEQVFLWGLVSVSEPASEWVFLWGLVSVFLRASANALVRVPRSTAK